MIYIALLKYIRNIWLDYLMRIRSFIFVHIEIIRFIYIQTETNSLVTYWDWVNSMYSANQSLETKLGRKGTWFEQWRNFRKPLGLRPTEPNPDVSPNDPWRTSPITSDSLTINLTHFNVSHYATLTQINNEIELKIN